MRWTFGIAWRLQILRIKCSEGLLDYFRKFLDLVGKSLEFLRFLAIDELQVLLGQQEREVPHLRVGVRVGVRVRVRVRVRIMCRVRVRVLPSSVVP